jgi:hypothetical protein
MSGGVNKRMGSECLAGEALLQRLRDALLARGTYGIRELSNLFRYVSLSVFPSLLCVVVWCELTASSRILDSDGSHLLSPSEMRFGLKKIGAELTDAVRLEGLSLSVSVSLRVVF